MTRTPWRDPHLASLLFVAVVCFVAFWDLGTRSLHVNDTARWGQLAREMIDGGEWLVPHRYGDLYVNKPPLYLWAVALPSVFVGDVTPFLVRLPSALGLLALVFGTAAWARHRLGGDVRTGRLAALLALSVPAVLWLGREGRLDAFGAGLAVLSAWRVDVAASGKGSRAAPWIAGGLLGLSMLAKGPPLWIGPLLAWSCALPGESMRTRWRAARPWILLSVAVALALAWFVPAVVVAGWSDYGRPLLVGQTADRLAGESTHTHGPFWYLGNVPLALGPVGAAALALGAYAFAPSGRRALGPASPLARAFVIGVVLFSCVPTKHERYLVPLVPFATIALAHTLIRWSDRVDPRVLRRIAVGGSVALALVGAAAIALLPFTSRGPAWPVVIVGAGLVAFAGSSVREALRGGGDVRRVALVGASAGVALALLAAVSLRSRFASSDRDDFARALARHAGADARVVTLHGTTPESIFHAARRASLGADVADVAWADHAGRWIVVARAGSEEAIAEASGREVRRLATRENGRIIGIELAAAEATSGPDPGD